MSQLAHNATDLPTHRQDSIPYFREIVGCDPYPWQCRLYSEFLEGRVPETVDIPTGLGKTSSVLLFLLARIRNRALPTRVVYIVDRRAIVDQTAAAIRDWTSRIATHPDLSNAFEVCSAFPSDRPVGLGVLRGGLADDGLWRVDPARPTVVIGTVDLVGSRIMFSGYGDGRSRRSMHAGLLGHDSIVMLDEAHLSPAMAALLRSIRDMQGQPKFRCMTLSATAADEGQTFRIDQEDESNPNVRRRLHAAKAIALHQVKRPADRVRRICTLAAAKSSGSVAIYVRTVSDAGRIAENLTHMLGTGGSDRVALLTGTIRGHERARLTDSPIWGRFLSGREREQNLPAVYLVMTAAGEVGVDLDADHGVMDLAPLDSIIQRAGRINRMGLTESSVDIVCAADETTHPPASSSSRKDRLRLAVANTFDVLNSTLPDLSPAALRRLDRKQIEACTVPTATPVPLHRETIESFALTSAALQLPRVSTFLRGVSLDPDPPHTFLLWRREVPDLVRVGSEAAKAVISFYRPAAAELARVPIYAAREIIDAARDRLGDDGLPVIVVRADGEVLARTLNDETNLPLAYATVFLPTAAGGLEAAGLPSSLASTEVSDVGDNGDRIRYRLPAGADDAAGPELPDWLSRAIAFRLPLGEDEDAERRFLVYAMRRHDPSLQTAESELTWLGNATQTVEEHCSLVGEAARRIGSALGLPEPEIRALEAAGNWHDRGKVRPAWQRAAGIPRGGEPLAKSKTGRFRPWMLGGYRHEFGSLADAERELPADCPDRDLILHLIASHHGWARPGFPDPRQWDPDLPAASNRRLAVATATRFSNLQARYGPWRLAWLEALLKAADAHASGAGRRTSK